jgi:DNA-binding response OmpR family regulator
MRPLHARDGVTDIGVDDVIEKSFRAEELLTYIHALRSARNFRETDDIERHD